MTQILDADGRPITREALGEPQTAQVTQLHRIFEEHPARGLTPSSLHRILTAAEQGDLSAQHDLFRDMEDRDGHILTEMFKRKAALQGLDWTIVPPPDASAREKADAEWLSDPFEFMIGWCENTQSKIILGQTLSADAKPTGLGSGVSNLHNEVRHDILAADARQVARTLTRHLVWPILTVNRPGADPARCPKFRFDLGETEDLAAFADALPKLAAAGMQIPVSYAHEKLRIPQAKDGEPILGTPQNALPEAADPLLKPAKPAALKREGDPAPITDAIDDLVDDALQSWEPDLLGLLAPVQAALDQALADGESLADFQRRIADLLPAMDVSALGNRLALAAFVARLAGEAGLDANGQLDDPARGA